MVFLWFSYGNHHEVTIFSVEPRSSQALGIPGPSASAASAVAAANAAQAAQLERQRLAAPGWKGGHQGFVNGFYMVL